MGENKTTIGAFIDHMDTLHGSAPDPSNPPLYVWQTVDDKGQLRKEALHPCTCVCMTVGMWSS